MDNLEKQTVVQLKDLLKSRGLPTAGNKPALIQRLTESLNEEKQILQPISGEEIILGDGDLDNLPEEDVLGLTTPSSKDSNDSLNESDLATPDKPSQTTSSPQKATEKAEKKRIEVPKNVVLKSDDLTVEEKKIERAKKFNTDLSVEDKKSLRAKRFALENDTKGTISNSKTNSDPEALKKRAERFGLPVKSTSAPSGEDSEKLKQRAERFGSNLSGNKTGSVKLKSETEEKLQKRKDRFGPATKDEEIAVKKEKRAERFAGK